MKASVAAPNSASTSSAACQSTHCTSAPPASGLSMAMSPRPPSARDMTRAPSCGSYRSRTIERPQVTAAAIAAPCKARHAMSQPIDGASADSTLATVYSAMPASRTGRRP